MQIKQVLSVTQEMLRACKVGGPNSPMARPGTFLRWIIVLPIAFIGGLAADGFIHFANSEFPFISDVLGAAAFHGVFVWLGVEVAPSHRDSALRILTTISLVIGIILTVGTVIYAPSIPAWTDYFIGLARFVGAGLAFRALK